MLTDLFGGPVSGPQASCGALNAEIPWARECLLGTKPLSRQRGANPGRKQRVLPSMAAKGRGVRRLVLLQAAHRDREPVAIPAALSSQPELPQPPGCLPPSPWQQSHQQPPSPSWIHRDTETLSTGHGPPPRPFRTSLNPQGLSGHATPGHPAAGFHGNTETLYACICGYYSNPGRARCTEDKVPIWRNHSQKTRSLPLCPPWAGRRLCAGASLRHCRGVWGFLVCVPSLFLPLHLKGT